MRKGQPLIEQLVQEDLEGVKDGNIKTEARAGLVMDIEWDPLRAETTDVRYTTFNRTPVDGGLWLVDAGAPSLRLLLGDQLLTVLGPSSSALSTTVAPSRQTALQRDGVARILPGKPEDAYATLSAPLFCLRTNIGPTFAIAEGYPLDNSIHSRTRILNTLTWNVKTLTPSVVDGPLDSFPLRSFDHRPCIVMHQHNPNSTTIYLWNPDGTNAVRDVSTEALDAETPESPPKVDDGYLSMVSNLPLFCRTIPGALSWLILKDYRNIATLEVDGPFAYIKSTSALVRVSRQDVTISTNFALPYRDKSGDFKPWKRPLGYEDRSVLIDNDVLPGSLLLTHDLSGRTWRVHRLFSRRSMALWQFRVGHQKLEAS